MHALIARQGHLLIQRPVEGTHRIRYSVCKHDEKVEEIALDTEILPLVVGIPAPDFSLVDVLTEDTHRLSDYEGQIAIINFWSPECPWSNHYDPYWAERHAQWKSRGISLIQINSNANETVEELIAMSAEFGLPGPILRDEGNVIADVYGATHTPHVYIVDRDGLLSYVGAIDDRNFRQREASVNYLDAAIDALLAGDSPDPAETPAYGCTIVRAFD